MDDVMDRIRAHVDNMDNALNVEARKQLKNVLVLHDNHWGQPQRGLPPADNVRDRLLHVHLLLAEACRHHERSAARRHDQRQHGRRCYARLRTIPQSTDQVVV